MSSANPAELLLSELVALLARIDMVDAPVAAAYLESTIDALCREHDVVRYLSILD